MADFETWFYAGVISILLIIIFWVLQRYIGMQESKNIKFFDLMESNEKAITRLNTILDLNEKICTEKHRGIDRRLINLEDK